MSTTNFPGNVSLGSKAGSVVTIGGAATSSIFQAPTLTTTERNALTAVAGMTCYNSTTGKLNVYTGAGWEAVTSA